jgi:hypothetical protein
MDRSLLKNPTFDDIFSAIEIEGLSKVKKFSILYSAYKLQKLNIMLMYTKIHCYWNEDICKINLSQIVGKQPFKCQLMCSSPGRDLASVPFEEMIQILENNAFDSIIISYKFY